MDLKPLLKQWRIWVLIIAIAASIAMLGPTTATNEQGEPVMQTNLNKGLEIQGGVSVLVSINKTNVTQEEASNVATILQSRVSGLGLTQSEVQTVQIGDTYQVQVEAATEDPEQIEEVLTQEGSFEARMPIHVRDTLSFQLDNEYTFERNNDTVNVNNTTYGPGQNFTLDETRFYYLNNTENYANLEVVAYDGEDVSTVVNSDASVTSRNGQYSFEFPIVLTSDAADRAQRVFANYEPPTGSPRGVLSLPNGEPAMQRLYVDNQLRNSLTVDESFARSAVTRPFITGGGETQEQARNDMQELQSILSSGRLEYGVQIERNSTYSAQRGSQFMAAAFVAIIASVAATGALVHFRYRSLSTSIPIVITGSSEVLILLGAWFSTVATLNLASIAGIIAAVGTGVDDQIIIKDESEKEALTDWRKKIKNAFFAIFTSAASTIGAMLPLINPTQVNMLVGVAGVSILLYMAYKRSRNIHMMGIGVIAAVVSFTISQVSTSSYALQDVRGFAVTTIVGILIGIAITRPAYAKVLEHFES
jgi:preprotein translocase subunit SecD